jgi:Hemerythrin HHE cation binding domain
MRKLAKPSLDKPEEEVFYPAARQSIEDVDLIDEAEVEHATAKDLIEQLSSMSVNDDKFAAKFRVLGEYINHHVREEEGEMFPEFTRAKTDWAALCDEMHSRRAELEEEFLPNGQSAQSKQAGKETNSDDDEDIDRPAHVASQPTVSRGSRSAKPHQ